ncbi:hypothetical protein LWI29_000218 [Acer saccharum]|uniref:CCHC-type domain-containing protein n=1 Tax=Acer saccharum TaxID=4024 RepID=A0AA39TLU3_ACESA|nr:hypothetical protein LWI29_000218 [Acer saccharum]
MQDELIPLYEGFDTARKIMDMLEDKYGPKSETYIQLLLEQFNALKMSENDSMVDHILKLEIIAKDLSNAGHEISDKMQVSTLSNSLPESWDHVVTSLTYGQKDLSMVTLPALLAVEEVRMKRRKKNNGNLLMAEDSNKVQGKNFKKRKAHNQGKKQKQNSKKKRGCFVCGDMGHFKANCPKRKKNDNQQKEVVLTVSEALIVESENHWWMDSGATRHVCKDKNSFFVFKDKALGEHRLYMGNNTYVDVLGEGDCKIISKTSTIILKNVLYAPSIRRNLVSVSVLEKKGFEIRFKSGLVTIGKNDIVLLKGNRIDDMYSVAAINKNESNSDTSVSSAVWAKRFVNSLQLGIPDVAVNVFCDSKSAISLVKSGANSPKAKHIDVNYHYILDIVERGEIKVDYIPSGEMVADPMTKGLSLEKF